MQIYNRPRHGFRWHGASYVIGPKRPLPPMQQQRIVLVIDKGTGRERFIAASSKPPKR